MSPQNSSAPALPTRPVGPLQLSEIGYGAASLGNLYRAIDDEQAAAAVAAAWDAGIRYFDTAPHYGLGLSERRLGAALRGYDRDAYVVSSKVGRLIVPREEPIEQDTEGFVVPGTYQRRWDFSERGIRESIEASLERMGLDHLDIAFVHDPDVSGIPGAADAAAKVLIALRDEGMVAAVGIGTNSAAAAAELFRQADIDVAMLAGRYTLLESAEAEDVFAAAGDRPIIAVGVFNSGLLARDRPQPGANYNYEPAPAEILDRAGALADVAEAHGATLPQAAIAFPLRNRQVASVVLGMASAEHVQRNIALYADAPPEAMWADTARISA